MFYSTKSSRKTVLTKMFFFPIVLKFSLYSSIEIKVLFFRSFVKRDYLHYINCSSNLVGFDNSTFFIFYRVS